MDRDNIVLIGMPASGKSTVGVVLAKLLGLDFIDTDLLIQRREGRRLPEIIAAEGLEGFLAIENRICADLNARRAVIATGGSVIYGDQAMAHLRSLGRLVYLEVPLEALRSRLSDMRGRGVALREGQTLDDLYAERTVLYARWAELTVSEAGRTLEETVAAVREAVTQRNIRAVPGTAF